MNIIYKIARKIKHYRNPVGYWRSMGVQIGDKAEIYRSVSFGSEPYLITLGNHVRVNEHVTFVTHDGGVWVLRGLPSAFYLNPQIREIDLFGRITVGDNVHIGNNAIIMPGVTIGSNCVIGCGAIVTRDIPDNSIAVGIPARVIENIDVYFKKHEKEFDYTKGMNQKKKQEYLLKKYNLD